MSLKAFHIFFISICSISTLSFLFWAVGKYNTTSEGDYIYYIVLSVFVFVALLFYGYNFLKKINVK